jgi:maltose alpha-D-glucosyltransferase / alpha-amylase
MGVTALWILPFYPSPLKDDGYDITDYLNINPDYGDLETFRRFLNEAHSRRMRIITKLVLNHTSDQHPWFQRARRAKPDSQWRDFYVWSNTPDKYKEARVIFQDFESSNWSWDQVAGAYYWHRFYSHQPDLNYDNPLVQNAMLKAIDFWFEMGVDGMRLDAIPYLYEREGTNCENLPETHAFLKKLRAHIDAKFKDKMLLAEANQWPEDAVAYFGSGDESQMAFHFPLMPRIFMAIQMEDRFPIIDMLGQTPPIPENCQWALFLRNHDELTLEMVTDEERDYMYRVYVQDPKAKINLGIRRRLSPLLDNNPEKIHLANMLLLSLPGTPVIYYGDEIGMGDNYLLGDRNGVRTPMQWNGGKNAGFSEADPDKLYLPVITDPQYSYKVVNVDREETHRSSLLWWTRQAIAARKMLKLFGRGDLKVLNSRNPKILAFTRSYMGETVLSVANLSRFPQPTELDLTGFEGLTPIEAFSRSAFPKVEGDRYCLTVGPHDCYWFSLKKEVASVSLVDRGTVPEISGIRWEDILDGRTRNELEEVLQSYSCCCQWFEKGKVIQSARIIDSTPLPTESDLSFLLIVEFHFIEGLPDHYLLPISFAPAGRADTIAATYPQAVIARLRIGGNEGIIYDGTFDEELRAALLSLTAQSRKIEAYRGHFEFLPADGLGTIEEGPPKSEVVLEEPGSTYVIYGDSYSLKIYRYLEKFNHSFEMAKFLSDKGFPNIPPYAGGIDYISACGEPMKAGIFQRYMPNEGDAWNYTMGELERYFERIISARQEIDSWVMDLPRLLEEGMVGIPLKVRELIGGVYLEMAGLMGSRMAEMHLMLATPPCDCYFAPEPFSTLYQKSLYQSMRTSTLRTLRRTASLYTALPESLAKELDEIRSHENEISERLKGVTSRKISGLRIRIHGDYRLEHLLYTGKDFMVFGFGGRYEYTQDERRLKRSPLRDVASMIISFNRVVETALLRQAPQRAEHLQLLERWGMVWSRYVSISFLRSYFETMGRSPLLPDKEDIEILLCAFILYRAINELGSRTDSDSPEVSIKVARHSLALTELRRNL